MSRQAAPARQLARFQLLRELGRGAQARVWLAHDPRLDRDVALKLLDPAAASTMPNPAAHSRHGHRGARHEAAIASRHGRPKDEDGSPAPRDGIPVSPWLHEARAVSRLTHPNIVPVFEADEHEGQSYLVFEYVPGPTLAEAVRRRPVLPAREAVTLLLGVLDALAAAHEQGIVHRDLKPSNILLGHDGRARVMDFGIAARTAQGDGLIVGTAGYMSPEAARGEPPVPAMDVFAAGAMLGELLAGAPLLRETDPLRAVRRVQEEDLVLPAHAKVDETLRGIVQRALARDVRTRYDSARAMHAALAAWLEPVPGLAAEPEPGESHATLEFLLRRMRHKTDFPALSASVVRIQRLAASETDSLRSLADEILKDVALTNKLLRMVNSAHFTAVAGGGISTVSRAVALVGFGGIRNMALSVLLLEHMGDKAHAAQLKEEFLRALMAGTLASELAPLAREGEEAFLASMFQNLGRLLTEYYFQEEAVQIRQRITRSGDSLAAREAASRHVLGIGFEELGAGVARAWGLPETLQQALRPPAGEPPLHAVAPGVERMRWLGRGANALTEALLASDGEQQAAEVHAAAAQYAPALGLSAHQLVEATHDARTRLAQVAQAMGLQVAPEAPARRLLGPGAPQSAEAGYDKTLALAAESHTASHEALSQGLDELRSALATSSLRLNEVLNLVLDTMHRALAFRCVVLCLREPRSGHLIGRVGIGPGAAEASAAFRIVTGRAAAAPDLFAALCSRGADLLIADASTIATRLPAWYRQKVNAPTFLLLPMQLHGAPIGLIYADKATAGTILVEEKDLQLLRGLRDEAVAAFKRAGGKQEN